MHGGGRERQRKTRRRKARVHAKEERKREQRDGGAREAGRAGEAPGAGHGHAARAQPPGDRRRRGLRRDGYHVRRHEVQP